ncbi:MAG TPA: L-2-hydroxyglutarate oxidase [Gammaproteobacteria bacterium]|jgi:L-2-hydroxyglutarate oxidase|nr:L-2-hydroxyglutarate oxidase [Gammaproteobacteria bacterium]
MYDFVIIGGGIVGISTALEVIKSEPTKKVLLLEKEQSFASHQSGHNSGVVHAGVYYEPGSLKAKLCKEGLTETINYCKSHSIPFEQCGKLLVATSKQEISRMNSLYYRCIENEIDVTILDKNELNTIEPNIRGMGAILVKSTAIVNYPDIAAKMAQQYEALGGEYLLSTEVTSLDEDPDHVNILANDEAIKTRYLINCAGLMTDRIAKLIGIKTDFRIIPFRGEYYQLPVHSNKIIKHLIYPIPNPDLPFLGIHLTRMINGAVTVGPNAVLGFKREGYAKYNFNLKDFIEMISFAGFYRMAMSNIESGLSELINSISKRIYLKQVQKYCPSVQLNDLKPYPAGVRAQAVLKDGTLVHDFLFKYSKRSMHVCNAPSPAATSAIPIGRYITEKATTRLNKL